MVVVAVLQGFNLLAQALCLKLVLLVVRFYFELKRTRVDLRGWLRFRQFVLEN